MMKDYTTNKDKIEYTALSVTDQIEYIIKVQKMAGITSDQVDYVERRGKAAYLGDPIEVRALNEAFTYNPTKKRHSKHQAVLKAVEANIGYTDSAADIPDFIKVKVCVMLQNNPMPGQVNFSVSNEEFHWAPILGLEKTKPGCQFQLNSIWLI